MTPNDLPGRAPAAGPGGAEGGHPQPPSAAPKEERSEEGAA